MTKITDIEEKRLQIGYFLSRRKENRFAIETLYEQWCQWWKEDFQVDGVQMEMIEGELVLKSVDGNGEIQIQTMKYHNKVLQDVAQWFRNEHRDNMPRKWNSARLRQMMITYRGKSYNRLKYTLGQKRTGKEYYLVNRAQKNQPCKLGHYVLHKKSDSKNTCCCSGTYEKVMDYIKKNIKIDMFNVFH